MRLPSRLAVVTGALLVLLPALAVLQYHWLGQLGDATRERMQRNLHNAAQQFRDAFDSEIARALVTLQADTDFSRERYAERYDAWAKTTAYPWLVANVYLVDASASELRLQRWDPHARVFASAPWTGVLEQARPHFASELAAFASGERRPPDATRFRALEELLVAPLAHVRIGPDAVGPPFPPSERVFGFTVIQLNLTAVRDQLLPTLAQRHFSQTDADAYRVAVVDASTPRKVIYRSSPDAPTEPSRADVSVPLFGGHADPMLFLARGLTRARAEAGEKRRVVVSVIQEQRNDRLTFHSRLLSAEDGRWRLLAQHASGSLDAAVGAARSRNLIISFGILLLMGVSIGLLALSSRRAQQLVRQQMEFVAGVSHELRTPVTVIHSAAENLSHGVVEDPAHVRRYGAAIEREARRLAEMVERVLHFAGIESGRIVRKPLAVEPLIAEAIDAAIPRDGPPFTVERHIAPDLPLVVGDATALRSAIQNLVANAVKYGGADRWIRIRATSGRRGRESHAAVQERTQFAVVERGHGREVRISVEDRGPGINPADLPHIFEPFYRGADATKQQIQGSGLGLALVRAIAQAHGGGVSVLSHEGAGSTFTLHLPDAATMLHDKPLPFRKPNEAAAG